MGIDYKLSGSRIRAIRNARGMTAHKLGDLVGLTEDTILHLECGTRRPSYQTIYNIAVALDASLDYITGRVERPYEYVSTPIVKEAGLSAEQADLLEALTQAIAPVIKEKL